MVKELEIGQVKNLFRARAKDGFCPPLKGFFVYTNGDIPLEILRGKEGESIDP